MKIPPLQECVEGRAIGTGDTDIAVLVGSPGPTEVEIESVPAADPPAEPSRREHLNRFLDRQRPPGTEIRRSYPHRRYARASSESQAPARADAPTRRRAGEAAIRSAR